VRDGSDFARFDPAQSEKNLLGDFVSIAPEKMSFIGLGLT
jgi:hypothetical protein